MSTHTNLSCSGSDRWSHCAGSPREEAAYPNISGEAAISGTGTHLLIELCIVNNRTAASFVGVVIGVDHNDRPGGWKIDAERAARAEMCLAYIERRKLELASDYPHSVVTVEAESESNPGALVGRDDWAGTCDITIICTAPDGSINMLETCDYKDGRSPVEVEGNTQLISYLSGKIGVAYQNGHYVAESRISIVQPRVHPPIKYRDMTPESVMQAHFELAEAAKLTDDPNAPLTHGSWCKWCKHKKNCRTELETSVDFSLLGRDVTQLSNEELAQVYGFKTAVIVVFQQAETELFKRIDKGETIPGLVKGAGRVSKVWAFDEEDIVKALKGRKFKLNDIYPPKLVTPAQCLKSELLTEVQRETLTKKYITLKEGDATLKVVTELKIPDFF